MKKGVIIIFVTILFLVGVYLKNGSVKQEKLILAKESEVNMEIDNEINEIKKQNKQLSEEPSERVFLNLEYIGKMDNVNYRMRNIRVDINPKEDFTWWNYYTIDEYLAAADDYNFILPDEIDNMEYDIIISFGHKLKYLYYYENDYIYKMGEEGYRTRPIFEREFDENSAYVYLIDKTSLINTEFIGIDIEEFIKGNIPYELTSEDDEINYME